MLLELSPILPLIQSLSEPDSSNSIGVSTAIRRQYLAGQWSGNVLVTTIDRKLLYSLPNCRLSARWRKVFWLMIACPLAEIFFLVRGNGCTGFLLGGRDWHPHKVKKCGYRRIAIASSAPV